MRRRGDHHREGRPTTYSTHRSAPGANDGHPFRMPLGRGGRQDFDKFFGVVLILVLTVCGFTLVVLAVLILLTGRAINF